jgi:uroporphyrinogen-III synthase
MTAQSRPPLILLTRPLTQSQHFADQITAAFGPHPVLISPAMAIRALDVARASGDFSDVVLTSQNAPGFAARLGFPMPRHAFCVGDRTAEAARQAGFTTTALGGDAAGLIAALQAAPPQGTLLHLHGRETRGDVAASLTAAGIETISLAIYDQIALPLSKAALQALAGKHPVILPIFSPRTATILAAQGPFAAPLHIVAISDAVAKAAAALTPHRLEIAQSPDAGAMLDALGGILRHPRT